MDINDIVMISIYNYVDLKEVEYNEMYDKLCTDIALYTRKKITNSQVNINPDLTKQLIMHFLSVELNLEKFIKFEQQIMNFNIYDDVLSNDEREYNIATSHEIIKIYQKINQEQIIVDILNRIELNSK